MKTQQIAGVIIINIVLSIIICFLMMKWCGCCNNEDVTTTESTEQIEDIGKALEDENVSESATTRSASNNDKQTVTESSGDKSDASFEGKKPWIFFGGKSHDNPTISLQEMLISQGVIAKMPDDKSRKYTIDRWEFQAMYKNEIVGHAQVGPRVNSDMKTLMETVSPGDKIYIREAVAKDADGHDFVLDELELTVTQ